MAMDPSALDLSNRLEPSATEPAPQTHPAKTLLHQLGVDVSTFPSIRFLVETSEKSIRVGRNIIQLRLPDQPGYAYETVMRIIRVLEVPAVNGKGHRKFLELEWTIADEPSIDEQNHPALSFLASQVECAACREIFIPDPEIISDETVRLSCPNCLSYWSVSVALPSPKPETPELLFDLFQKDQSRLRNFLTRWTEGPVASHDKTFYSFFPFHFEAWNEASSLEWLFGESTGWTALANNSSRDFESLSRGLLNFVALEHFKTYFSTNSSSQLDQTEIQRKTEVVRREESARQALQKVIPGLPEIERTPTIPNREIFDVENTITPTPIRPRSVSTNPEARFVWTAPDTAVKEVPLRSPRKGTKPNSYSNSSSSALYFSIGATLVVLMIVGGLLFYNASKTFRAADQMATDLSLASPPKVSKPADPLRDIPQPQAEAPKPVAAPEQPAPPVVVKTETPKVSLEKATKSAAPSDLPKLALPSQGLVKKVEKEKAKEKEREKESFKESAEQKHLRELAVDSSFRQGMLHLKLQQAKEAINEFNKVLSLDPKHAEAYRGLGLAHVYEQNFEDAISSLNHYLTLSGNPYDRTSVEELIATLRERTGK